MTSKFITAAKKRSKPSKPRWKPPTYQRKALGFLLDNGAAALFLDPGLGKTSISLAACKVVLTEGVSEGVLVIAPLRPATTTWPREREKWADFEKLDLVVLHGKDRDRLLREDHQIYVINYEAIPQYFTARKVGKVTKYELTEAGKILMAKVDTLIWDELSKMKNPSSKRYKLVKPWLKKFQRRWGLTGSPASNGLMDLFGQCYVLDEGRSLGPFITHYRSQYFDSVGHMGYDWALKPGAAEAIYERLRPLALRMEAEDYITLPKPLPHAIKLDMPPEARKIYEEVEDEFLTVLDTGEMITADNAASASSKCRQICAGALYLPTIDPVTGVAYSTTGRNRANREFKLLHDVKLDAMEDLMEELQGQQLLVAYEFRSDLERLLARFPKLPYIGGGVSVARAAELEAAWNAGTLPALAGHPASIGHGLNLQESGAHNVLWFNITWDFELYDQFNRRLRRQGNTAPHVNIYHLVMKDTVEESVMYALRRKDRTQKALLDALKNRRRLN